MDELIRKYDYTKEDRKSREQMLENLQKNQQKYAEKLNLEGLKKILSEFTAKICVSGFTEPSKSKASWMSLKTVDTICSVMQICINNTKITNLQCQKCVYDLIIQLLKSGPSLVQMEIIYFLLKTKLDMKVYLQSLSGPMIKELVDALEQFEYTENKKTPLKDYCVCFKKCISYVIDCFMEFQFKDFTKKANCSDKKILLDKSVHGMILSLYIKYLVYITELPEEFEVCLSACLDVMCCYYDRSVYMGCKDRSLIKSHLNTIRNILGKSGYPRSTREVLHLSRALQSLLECSIENDHVTDLWEELLEVSRHVCLCTGSSQMSSVLVTYQTFYDDLPKKIFQNKNIFTKWAAVHIHILNEVKSSELLVCFIPNGVRAMLKNHVSSSGDEVQWIAVLHGLLKHPHMELTEAALNIVEEPKLKRIWGWKDKIEDVKKIIGIIKCIEIPSGLDKRDRRSILSDYGKIVRCLLEQLKSLKLSQLVMGEVLELIMHVFKLRSEDAFQINAEIGHLELQNSKDCLLEVIKQFEPLFTDESYPWSNYVVSNAGLTLIQSVNDAYSSGSEIPDDINQCMLNIFCYCMEDNIKRYDEDTECNTVFGLVYMTVLPSYCFKIANTSSSAVSHLVPKILKMINDPDEKMSEVAKGLIMQIGTMGAPQIFAPHLKFLLEWCLSTSSKPDSVLYSLPSIYPYNIEPMSESFQDLFQKFCINMNAENYGYVTPILMKVAELQPELFTKDNVNVLCQYLDDSLIQYQIIVVLSSLSQQNPNVLCYHMEQLLSIKDQTFIKMGAYYINMILVNVAYEHQKYVKPVFEYLMKRLNVNLKDQNNILQMIDGLQRLSDRYQTGEINKYRECLTALTKSGPTPMVRITATSLLQDLDRMKK